jgi:hypothetical protein
MLSGFHRRRRSPPNAIRRRSLPPNIHSNPGPGPFPDPRQSFFVPLWFLRSSLPSSRPSPLSHRSTERPTASVTAPSTHFIPPTLVSFSHTPGGTAVTRRNPPPSGPVLVWALGPLFLLCPKKEKIHRAPSPESWGPSLSSDRRTLQVAALVIGRARGSPAHTAVHCVLDWALYPRSVTVKRVRFLASRAPNQTFVPGETRSNCWLRRLTFLKLPT